VSVRQVFRGGGPFEEMCGYARAIRVGPLVAVAGCSAATADGPVGGADVQEQTRECLRRVESALVSAGVSLADVIRTRIFVTDMSHWQAIGAVHAEVFAGITPASAIYEVRALVQPDLLVEVEADAYVADAVHD
jgi:enamine deaminase RidA (YjgF/YER057c/UK114 family)